MANNFIKGLASVFPQLRENTGLGQVGIVMFPSGAVGPPLLVDSATYKQALFIAPVDNCEIVEAWLSGAVSIGSGTNTFAVDNYDASANAARNVLSTTNIDPDTITAKEGLKLTLSATLTNLQMDEGDVLNVTLVAGTQTTAGQGYVVTALVLCPQPTFSIAT